MNFKFLRGACVVIEGGGKRVLCDPWLDDGIYYGSWAHYPAYNWKDDLSTLDYIYVSHIHPDHFSHATMRRLPKVPVLIHKFQSKFLRKNIEALGFEVRELENNTPTDLGGGLKINIIAADDCNPALCQKFFGCTSAEVSTTQIDSMAVFDDGEHVYVNVNDCPYQLSKSILPKIRTQYPVIDVMMVAYAGAGPYPQCFSMSIVKKLDAAEFKKKQFLYHAAMFAKDLKPKQTFPFAGDYVLCGNLAHLNHFRGVASLEEVYDYFEHRQIPVIRTEIPDEYLRGKYIQDILAMRKMDYEYDNDVSDNEMLPLLHAAYERMHHKRKELGLKTETDIYIGIGFGGYYKISANEAYLDFTTKIKSERYVLMTADRRLLKRILMGPAYAHWNNAEIGSHIMYDRRPDDFERGLHQLMSFFHV